MMKQFLAVIIGITNLRLRVILQLIFALLARNVVAVFTLVVFLHDLLQNSFIIGRILLVLHTILLAVHRDIVLIIHRVVLLHELVHGGLIILTVVFLLGSVAPAGLLDTRRFLNIEAQSDEAQEPVDLEQLDEGDQESIPRRGSTRPADSSEMSSGTLDMFF